MAHRYAFASVLPEKDCSWVRNAIHRSRDVKRLLLCSSNTLPPPPQPPPKCAGNVAFCVEKTVSSFANRPHTAFSSQGHNSPLFYVTPYPCMPAGSQASASRLGIFLRPGALVWFCLHSITTPPCLAQVLSFPHFLLQESS